MTTTARANSVFPADNRRNLWAVDVHPDTTIEDIERPTFWAHEAAKLRQFDRIEVRWEDGQKWADAVVLAQGAGFARVAVINLIDANSGAADAPEQGDDILLITEVKWKGPSMKWAVIRTKDGHVVSQDHADKLSAYAAAAQYEKTVHG